MFRNSLKAFATLGFVLLLTGTQGVAALSAPPASEILRRADEIRFPLDSLQVDVQIRTEDPGREPELRVYRILSKGNDRTVVLTVAPAAERGQMMLMRERDLWVFLPRVSQPVRLPLSQKLTGLVANGDLARANFVGDYQPTLTGTERIEGVDHYVLELEAVDRSVTYPRVRYWVNSSNFHPYKAEFFALSGRLLKTCYYTEFEPMQGEIRPTLLLMVDALGGGQRSVMKYSNMKLRQLPDKVFTKQYLKKLQ